MSTALNLRRQELYQEILRNTEMRRCEPVQETYSPPRPVDINVLMRGVPRDAPTSGSDRVALD